LHPIRCFPSAYPGKHSARRTAPNHTSRCAARLSIIGERRMILQTISRSAVLFLRSRSFSMNPPVSCPEWPVHSFLRRPARIEPGPTSGSPSYSSRSNLRALRRKHRRADSHRLRICYCEKPHVECPVNAAGKNESPFLGSSGRL